MIRLSLPKGSLHRHKKIVYIATPTPTIQQLFKRQASAEKNSIPTTTLDNKPQRSTKPTMTDKRLQVALLRPLLIFTRAYKKDTPQMCLSTPKG